MALEPSFLQNTDGDDRSKQAALRRFQGDLIALESDRVKLARKVEEVTLELRLDQKKWTTLGLEIKEKQEMMKKSQSRLDFLDEEIRSLKRKINNL